MAGLVFGSSNNTSISNSASLGALNIVPTAGALVLAIAVFWNTAVGTNTGDIATISDTGGNTWTRLFSTVYSPSTIAGSAGLAAFYTIVPTSGSIQVSGTLTASFNHGGWGPYWWSSSGIFSPYIDTASIHTSTGTSASPTNTGFSPTFPYDGIILLSGSNASTGTAGAAGISTGYNFNLRNGSLIQGDVVQDYAYIGAGLSNATAPYTFTIPTNTTTFDWVTTSIGIISSEYNGMPAVEASAGAAFPYQFLGFQGEIFLGGYTGMPWLHNVFMLPRDVWDTGLSTPYSGQLFPVGPGVGAAGQLYPY